MDGVATGSMRMVVISDTRERLQMAAMVASVAAVNGSEVVVFVSMNALPFFLRTASPIPPAEGMAGQLLERKHAPPFKQLFAQAVEVGDARIHPCMMAMEILGMSREMLEPFLGEPMDLAKFLADGVGSQTWLF